ncbi:MAG: selenide, water dikinase SelD [Candidatus Puniceispirillaceae bacterium]
MRGAETITGDLVLAGGGHAQVAVLKSLAMKPVAGLRTTLVCRDINTPYSGMLPGFVEGVWSAEDIHIDLSRLAQMAGARFITASVTNVDTNAQLLHLEDRPPLPFDVLSLNIGGEPDLHAIHGAPEHCIPVKPIGRFRDRLEALTATGHPGRLAVIGGGAAGCELALALSKRWFGATGTRPQIDIYTRSARLVPEMPARAARLIFQSLAAAGINVHCGQMVTSVLAGELCLEDNIRHAFDACFLVTAVAPPSWLGKTGLTLDDRGFVAVQRTLQSVSHPHIFAAGDIATLIDDPRPKAGVYAVRAGPVLATNLRRHLHGRRLRRWSPQQRALAILGTADGRAIGIRGKHASASRGWWWAKKWIDRRWMAKYTKLRMPPPPPPAIFVGLKDRSTPETDPAFEAMRCLGCGAKTGHETLAAAMRDAVDTAVALGADPRLMPPDGLADDSAILPLPEEGELVQSIDSLSEIVSDPFLLGRIAAIHAMSDIYAANAVPVWAMANVTMGMARLDLQQHQLAQLMAGALLAFSEAGVQLVGGHTGESHDLGLGFAVTGWRKGPPSPPTADSGTALILTKPLGTGVIMAAHMHLAARGDWVAKATASMARGNAGAARILAEHNPVMTDVTGFGLARHALNLAERCDHKGVEIDIATLPCLDGAVTLLERGYRSTLHGQNKTAVRFAAEVPTGPALDIMFDPQTSGGLLAALPAPDAVAVLEQLRSDGVPAAIVGQLDDKTPGLQVRS